MAAALSDLSAAALIGTPGHNTINVTNIAAWETAFTTHWNNNSPAGTARATARTDNRAQLGTLFLRIAVEFAHNGTSSATKYNAVTIATAGLFTGAPTETWNLQSIVDTMAANNVTPRMFLRAYAQQVFRVAKNNNLSFRVGLKAGTEDKYAFATFDGSHYVTGMSTHERAAADAAAQIAIARSQGGATRINNALENTKGVIGSNSKTVMF